MTTQEFIANALTGRTKRNACSSVVAYTDHDGNVTIYSYGTHYPLVKILHGVAFVNNAGYSMTTAKHIHWAYAAAAKVVGNNNTYGVPLTNGDSLDKQGIIRSALRELQRIEAAMAAKKRTDTMVYNLLANDYRRMIEVLTAARQQL